MSNNNQKSNQGQYQNNKNNVKQSQYQQSDAFQNNQTNKKQENNERNIKTWNNNNQRNTQEEDKQNCNMKNNIKSQNKSKNQQFQNKQKNTSNQSQKENIEYVRKDNQQQNYLNQTSQNIIVDNNLQNYDKSSLLNETNNKMQDNQKIQTIKKNINKQSQKKNIEYVLKDNQQQNYQIQASQNLIVDNNQQNYDKTSLLNETNNNQHIQTIKKNTNKQSQKENIEYVRKDNQQQNYQSQNSQNLIVDNNQYNYDKTSLRNQHNNKMQDNQQILNKQKNINNQSQKQNIEYVRKDIQQQNDQTQVQLNQANQNILLDNNLQNYVKKSLHNEHNNKMPDNQQILDKQKNINNQSQKQNIEYVRKDNQQQNYLNQANKNLIVGNNQQNNDQISLHNEQNNQKLSDQQNTVRMFFNQQKLNNQNKYSNKIYFYEKKQESEQKIFVQQFLKNYLGLEKKKQNDKNQYNCYEFERLSMYKNLCYQFRKEFKQQIQQTIKFIEDWVQGNQSLIEKNQNNEQAYKKIQIFTSNFINLTKKLDQILIQSYEKLLKNQNLDDCSNQNDLLYILNEKKKQEEAENLDELNEIKELQNIQQIQRNENDHDSNSEIMSQKTFRSVQFDEDSALNSSFSSFQTHDSQNNESSKLNKEQKQKYQKFCWKIFHGFKKCLSIELAMNKRNLPAYQVGQEIQSLLEICQNPFILLMGSTGSGKTTQTPQILYQHQLMDVEKSNKVIYCVQPRKINCLTISERVANEMGCKLGEEVGYQVGYSACEQKFDRYKTKIIFITESLLMGMLVKQNKQKQKQNKKDFFQHCSYIILDEVHERSVKSDIIMGLAKTIFSEQTKIKFFLSSATADREMYLKYFTQLPIIEIPGKIYPVDEEFIVEEGSSVTKVIKHLNVVIDRIEQDVELHNGHMLVFMMDGQEIDECIKQATSLPKLDLHKYKLLPLHSRLERDQQELVFKEHFNDDDKQMKKIIFCTNIAETAITINNITIVIDCGMEKVAQFDPRKNITTIQSTFISKSSAKQRQGRAGRTCPGICYKLYSEEEYESFANEKIPEISRINIEQVLLQIIESGEKVETFPYFEKPDQTILKCSKDNLIRLGAIDEMNNSLTEIGRIMQKSELEPYQIKCLIDAYKLNVINEVTNILAVMPEIGGLFKREENQKQNTFYEKNGIKNEYNSDFLNYHNIFESIKILNKQSQCKKSLKENNIKYYVWQNILTSRYNIIRFRKKLETKHSEVLQNKQNQNQEDNTEVKVLKVMLNAYINQISIFSGIKYLGFIDMKSNIQFRIHPQSQYSRQNFDRGAILIYGNLEDREKSTYAKHISEIKFEWLKDQNLFNEEIYQRIKESKEEAQKNNFHHQIKASNFMIDQFRKLHFTKIKEKFLEYQDIYPKAKSFLILDTEQCLIKVASTKEGQIHYEQRQIGKYIEDLVNKERQIHRKRVIIRKFKESENYAVIGEGYKIIDILLPNQFVKVKVANIPTKNEYGEEITKNYIEKQFKLKNNNDYYDLYIHKSEKSSYAQIQFLTYESARKFVKNVNLDIISNSKAITVVGIPESNVKKNLFEKYSLNVYIPIDKPTGVGYLNFQNEIDRDETLEHLKNQQFNAQQCEKKVNGNLEYQIKLNNLLIHQNEEYLEKHVQQTQGGFINAVIIRKKSDSFDSDQEQIQLQQTYLRSYVTSIVLKEDIPQVYINIENEKTSYLKAKICFPKREYCEKFQQNFSKEITENGPLKIYFNDILSFFVDKDIYQLLEQQYQQFKKQVIYENVQFSEINLKNRFQIKIAIFKMEFNFLLSKAFNQLKTLFKPQQLIFDIEYWQLDRIMEQKEERIQQIKQQKKVIINRNPKKSILSVWFKEKNQHKRKKILNKIEKNIKSLFTGRKNIFLNNYQQIDKLTGFLRQKQKNHDSFTFEKNKQKIILEGQIKLIFDIFQEVNKQFRIPLKGDIQCQICYEQKNLERLDQCGCLFCKECILEYIVNFCSQFEVLCCPNHKDNPITLEDSYEIINCIEQDTIIEKKINDKIDGWKNLQDQLKFIRCPTANCDSFFGRVYKLPNGTYLDQSIPQNIRCSECYQSFCLLKTDARDKNSFVHECHQGNCENFQINQQYIEQMLLNENGRYCPTCKAPIIKNGGCDHMTCKSCGTHFCWKCVQVFDEAEIYKHLKICQKSN